MIPTGIRRPLWPGVLALALLAAAPLPARAYTGLPVVSPTEDTHVQYTRRARYAVPADDLYKSPVQLRISPDGRRLYVACEGTDEVLVADTRRRAVVDAIPVGPMPFDMLLSPGGDSLYVTHRWGNAIGVVDLRRSALVDSLRSGDDPHDLALSPDRCFLFVANLGTNDLSVIERATGVEVKRLPVGVAPFGLAVSPDGRSVYVSSQYSLPVPFRTPSVLELTVVDVEKQLVRERRQLFSTVVGQGVAATLDGHFAVTAVELPKNLIPETQVYQGWMVTYGLAFTESRPGGRTAYLLIDEPNLYFADPYDLALSPDGRWLYVTSSAADAVTVVDLEKAYRVMQVSEGRIGLSDEQIATCARHLALSNDYVAARIPTGANPKGLAISPDGRWLYVAERLEDRVLVIDARSQRADGYIDLGGPREETVLRRGAKLFSYASISFQKQMSCATCHPENSVDGLLYDIAVDGGMGRNLVD
ncbi:MAG: beta-propeller fold lactonase family protein, partial [Gemmatimonadota bacterium]